MVTAKANKLLSLLRRTCPMLTDVKIRISLYLALVKSQMSYETEVWSRAPSHSTLKQKAERVQRIANNNNKLYYCSQRALPQQFTNKIYIY